VSLAPQGQQEIPYLNYLMTTLPKTPQGSDAAQLSVHLDWEVLSMVPSVSASFLFILVCGNFADRRYRCTSTVVYRQIG
jgi:hypothetical protein